MEIPINEEHIKKVADEYGIKVEFDSPTPGIRLSDGSIVSWDKVMYDMFAEVGIDLKQFDEK